MLKEEEIENHLRRFENALSKSINELSNLINDASKKMGKEKADIFEAQLLMLQDNSFISEIRKQIQSRVNAEDAVDKTVNKFMQTFEKMERQYMKERALDVKDIGERVIKNLIGIKNDIQKKLHENTIIVAEDLVPSDTACMDLSKVAGFATDKGGSTSHVAIIARSYSIPAVVGLHNISKMAESGDLVVIDGNDGLVFVNPNDNLLKKYLKLSSEIECKKKELEKMKNKPSKTIDGRNVILMANIGGPNEIGMAISRGATGFGLIRTEFLYHNQYSPPSEEEQFLIYRTIAEKIKDKPGVIRTLDVGGDKKPAYFEKTIEPNPFLGWRGIRVSLDLVDTFKTQIRAILRASQYGNLKIMLPMISNIEEVRKANNLISEAKNDLQRKGMAFNKNIEVGIMIEVPSIALMADIVAKEVDFFSLGTNDLIQYTLAVDRTNEKVSKLYNNLHPGVLRLIKNVIQVSQTKNKWIEVCGEMASDIMAIPILIGLGLEKLSLVSPLIPETKCLIRSIDYSETEKLAEEALKLSTAKDVFLLVKNFLSKRT